MFILAFYVPVKEAEKVKESLFKAGAGKLGQYDYCSFESQGTGQFRPLKGSSPHIGELNQLEKVNELKVEMICEEEIIKKIIKILIETHPYETPAYHVIKLESF
jgi:hypothetical protein